MVVAGILVVLLGTGFVIVSLVVLAWRLQYRLLLRRLRAATRVTDRDRATRELSRTDPGLTS